MLALAGAAKLGMKREESITTWIGQLRRGDSDAAAVLWERYFGRLVSFARHKLRGTARGAADEEDVALSAFHSLCRNADRFPRLANRHDLWQVLVMLTARKAFQERKRQQAVKRGGERGDDGPMCPQPVRSLEFEIERIIGAEPTPEFAVMVAEMSDSLINRLPDEDLRTVARLRLEDYTNAEIAVQLACSERTIERKLTVIRGLWEQALSA